MKGSDRDVNGMMDIERIPLSSVSYMIVNSELTIQVEGEEKEGANPIHIYTCIVIVKTAFFSFLKFYCS